MLYALPENDSSDFTEAFQPNRLIVPSPVPAEPGVASVTCGTVSPLAATSAAGSGIISASHALPAKAFTSACHPVAIASSPR